MLRYYLHCAALRCAAPFCETQLLVLRDVGFATICIARRCAAIALLYDLQYPALWCAMGHFVMLLPALSCAAQPCAAPRSDTTCMGCIALHCTTTCAVRQPVLCSAALQPALHCSNTCAALRCAVTCAALCADVQCAALCYDLSCAMLSSAVTCVALCCAAILPAL